MGRLEAIWVKRAHRGPMDAVTETTVVAGRGIVGNADQGRLRQVTLIEREVWDRLMSGLGASVDPSARRANLMISGVPLEETRERILRVGECRVRIRGHTRPCERMDEAFDGLRDAMTAGWGGGAFGEILDDGKIRVGDTVAFDEADS